MKNVIYVLDGREPVECEDAVEWQEWLSRSNRQVALTEKDRVRVSTVFTGVNHGLPSPAPLVFEAIVFGGGHDRESRLYATWEEAEKGHAEVVCEVGLS